MISFDDLVTVEILRESAIIFVRPKTLVDQTLSHTLTLPKIVLVVVLGLVLGC